MLSSYRLECCLVAVDARAGTGGCVQQLQGPAGELARRRSPSLHWLNTLWPFGEVLRTACARMCGHETSKVVARSSVPFIQRLDGFAIYEVGLL